MEKEESMSHDIYEKLIDRIILLNKNEDLKSVVDLFERACLDLNIVQTHIIKEDINYLGLYSSQIILNNNDIFIKAASGSTTKEAYENSIRKYINECLAKKNEKARFPEFVPESFYLELEDSIDSIALRDRLKTKLKEICQEVKKFGQLSMMCAINYSTFKTKLSEQVSDMQLTEIYRDLGDGMFACTLILNELFLLQQGEGNNKKEALENTAGKFFTTYEIISNEDLKVVPISNGSLGKEEILRKVSKLFQEKTREGTVNYWDTIQDCLKILNLEISVKSGEVKINDILICNIREENEYVGNIKAGKELVKMLKEDRRKPQPAIAKPVCSTPGISNVPKIMNFPKTNTIYVGDQLEMQLKSMAENAQKDYLRDQRQMRWNVLNRVCLNSNCKFDPCYSDKNGEKICALMFQEGQVISGSGDDKISAREDAAKKFIDKYLQGNNH